MKAAEKLIIYKKTKLKQKCSDKKLMGRNEKSKAVGERDTVIMNLQCEIKVSF